jgi:hypothetical protein
MQKRSETQVRQDLLPRKQENAFRGMPVSILYYLAKCHLLSEAGACLRMKNGCVFERFINKPNLYKESYLVVFSDYVVLQGGRRPLYFTKVW